MSKDYPEVKVRLDEAIRAEDNEGFSVFVDTRDNFHPYECSKGCIHCNREETDYHNPQTCALCNL